MAINSMDNKFGLPKPDFQAPPKKKINWPFLIVVAMIAIAIGGKAAYNFYVKLINSKKPISSTVSIDNGGTIDQAKDNFSASPPSCRATSARKMETNIHKSVSDNEALEYTKSANIKESISATQKKLAARKKKPLIKPGTYQELKRPQGIYHLVVVSHLDKQIAMKEVQQLIKKNLGVCLILPRIDKGEKYYRVTIGHSKTQYEAEEKLKEFKPTYAHIFVLKY